MILLIGRMTHFWLIGPPPFQIRFSPFSRLRKAQWLEHWSYEPGVTSSNLVLGRSHGEEPNTSRIE